MKVKALIAAVGLAVVAPIANADTAQLELLPRIGGAEMTQIERSAPVASEAIRNSDAFFYANTGGVSPQ
ncbi:MAG: hypothetical protein KJ025_22265 [Burkholderiales bacterium]|nr:hypothetical protein [Burkholderiales bacterium]